ncbi:MAG: cysteine hydrolase family protein [Candidatus Izemoplasmatales bacterium]
MKKALIVIDFQNDFVSGSLGFENASLLDTRIHNRIEEAIQRHEDLYFTFDTHESNYLETYEGKNLPVEHCLRGSFGHQLFGTVANFLDKANKVFYKPTFPSLELANYLSTHPYDEVELCGLVSNICVISNAVMVKSALPNARIIVNHELTDSYDSNLNNLSLEVMKGMQIEVI